MATVVAPNTILEAILSALVGTGGGFDASSVILFTNDITPDPTTVIGDLTEATFDGYAAVAGVTWSGPFITDAGIAELVGSGAFFACTGSTVSEIAYGYALTNVGKTELRAAARFDTPKQFNGVGDALMVIPRVQAANQGV